MAIKEICGCIHLHTTFSDGGCDYDMLVGAAKDAVLDYICVTDHRTLEGLRTGRGGTRDGVFVLVGYEHNDENNLNHYLAFGVNDTAEGVTEPQEYINHIKKAGGTGFLAHPAECRDAIKGLPPYPWTKWDVTGFDGIEIWNQISDWMEQLRGWQSFARFIFPNRYLRDAPRELLDRWDTMNRERFVSAIGGVDAHTRKFSYGPFKCVIFPIKTELRCVRTHYFVDDAQWADEKKREAALLTAMKDGKGFISNFHRGDAKGCKIFLTDDNAVEYPGRPANHLRFPQTMNVQLTHKARIKLLRNGQAVQSALSQNASWPINEPGVYRVEVYRGSGAWIYSNPFPVGQYPL